MTDIPPRSSSRLAVYAVGGNALSDPALKGAEARSAAEEIMNDVLEDVVDLLEAGIRVVLTHGNGPQVGELLLMEESLFDRRRGTSSNFTPQPLGLDNWVAATQGTLGHEIATNLENILRARGRHEQVVTLLTRVEVDANDSAFNSPTKPIGPIIDDLDTVPSNWEIGITNADAGPRRVVASPKPISIIDSDAIETLISAGAVVLCAGGGGIPVVSSKRGIQGVEAVIDKDRVSALLAVSLNADFLFISTAIDSVKLDFGSDNERNITTMSISEANQYLEDGQFPVGSMGPKIEAMLFAKQNGSEMSVSLCQPGDVIETMRGAAGTTITE
ncbi:MAG: carbamate kinase [Methanobacteriota archaeon]|nr:MAG: carbamate kinase [Euryarchaeota archaeon]HIG20580.1 carbamate kinase [Candidatus Poseidoniales archaeon]